MREDCSATIHTHWVQSSLDNTAVQQTQLSVTSPCASRVELYYCSATTNPKQAQQKKREEGQQQCHYHANNGQRGVRTRKQVKHKKHQTKITEDGKLKLKLISTLLHTTRSQTKSSKTRKTQRLGTLCMYRHSKVKNVVLNLVSFNKQFSMCKECTCFFCL